MQEDNFFNELDFASLRDCSGGPEVNQYQAHLDECAIKGKKAFLTDNEDELILYTKEQFKLYAETDEEAAKFNCKTDFVLVGDEYIEGISDPDELEDALNSWGVY